MSLLVIEKKINEYFHIETKDGHTLEIALIDTRHGQRYVFRGDPDEFRISRKKTLDGRLPPEDKGNCF